MFMSKQLWEYNWKFCIGLSKLKAMNQILVFPPKNDN